MPEGKPNNTLPSIKLGHCPSLTGQFITIIFRFLVVYRSGKLRRGGKWGGRGGDLVNIIVPGVNCSCAFWVAVLVADVAGIVPSHSAHKDQGCCYPERPIATHVQAFSHNVLIGMFLKMPGQTGVVMKLYGNPSDNYWATLLWELPASNSSNTWHDGLILLGLRLHA